MQQRFQYVILNEITEFEQQYIIVAFDSGSTFLPIITYGYEPPVTDVSKPNKQRFHKCSATTSWGESE
jgi:hypothetical protein